MTRNQAAALLIDRRVRRRAAAEAIPVPGGLVVRHRQLADVHYLNAVLLDARAGAREAREVVALGDRWLQGLGHRHVVFDDAPTAERLAAALAADGWERRRTLFMGLAPGAATAGAPEAPDPRARRISDAEMEQLQLTALREEVPQAAIRSGLVRRLAATQRALRAGTPARCFGAGEDDGLQSMCTLYLDDDVMGRRVALIEEVGTLSAHRGRGLARAVVGAAVRAARHWGAELVVVPADADDWPQLMYARMGFASLVRQVSLTLRRPAEPAGRPRRAAPDSSPPGL